MRKRHPMIALILAGAALAGCAGRHRSESGDPRHSGADRSPRAALLLRAADERGRRFDALHVPPPPGVDPTHLVPPAIDGGRARLSVAEAIDAVVAALPSRPAPDQSPALDLAARVQAQRKYAAGLAAATEGRHFVAVQELEAALAIDATSPAIVRHLARSYAATRNAQRAAVMYERLLQLVPGDVEAGFTVGLNAANQRRFAEAIAAIGPPRVREGFRHDPAADILADQALAYAFHDLGYDRAGIECGVRAIEALNRFSQPSAYAAAVASLKRQEGDLRRAMGDAHARLGEYPEALAAYDRAEEFPEIVPAVLAPRRMYVNLRLGRVHAAQQEVIEFVLASKNTIDERVIQWCDYLRDHAGDVRPLAGALADVVASSADPALAARLSASLVPLDEGVELLRRFVLDNPDDLDAVEDLYLWLARDDAGAAALFASRLADGDDQRAIRYADTLSEAVGLSTAAIHALRDAEPTPGTALVEGRMFLGAAAAAEAWNAVLEAPGTPPILMHRAQVAAAMKEPELLEAAIAQLRPIATLEARLAECEALREIGRHAEAVAVGRDIVSLWPDSAAGWLALARAQAARPETASDAASSAERTIALDPRLDGPYQVLLTLHAQDGPLADSAALQDAWQRLSKANPEGRLARLIEAERLSSARRSQQALDMLMALLERHPGDGEIVGRIVQTWIAAGEINKADEWLRSRLAARPDDPNLLRQRVRVLLQRDESGAAEELLRARLDADAADPVASSLLEVVLRTGGRASEAARLAEARLLRRPEGVQRSVDLASLRVSEGRIVDALSLVAPLLERFETLPRETTASLLGLAMQMPEDRGAGERARLDLVERFIARFPDAPLSVYGAALVSMGRLDATEAALDEAAGRAMTLATGGSAGTLQAATTWRDVSQALLDSDRPLQGGRVAFLRLTADHPLERPGRALLAQVAQACFVIANRLDLAIAVIDYLDRNAALDVLPLAGELSNRRAEALYWLSIFCTQSERHAFADELLVESLSLVPDNAMAMNNLGYRRIVDGRRDEGTIAIIERAHDLAPDDPNVLDTVAWLRYRQGRFGAEADGAESARSLLERSLAVSVAAGREPSAEVYDHLGDALWRLGERDRALQAWQTAARIIGDPGFRNSTVQSFHNYQRNVWGLAIFDAEALFEVLYGETLRRAGEKVRAAESGGNPAVAPTFSEQHAESATD